MFRNLTFFRFPLTLAAQVLALASAPLDTAAEGGTLEDLLGECKAKPVGPLELSSRGWVPSVGAEYGLGHRVGTCVRLVLGGEDKILPASAVMAELQKRLDKVREQDPTGRPPGGKARKRLKDEVLTDLLPRALVKPYRLEGYLDLERGLVVVDTASRKAAEGFVSEVRRTLGSFPALPLNAEVAPRVVLTDWLLEGGVPDPCGDGNMLSLGDSCELHDAASDGGMIRVAREELGGTLLEHLEDGKQCVALGLTLGDRVSFVANEDLSVTKLKLLDGAVDSLETVERDTMAQELDARLALLSGEVGQLFDVLAAAFKFSAAETAIGGTITAQVPDSAADQDPRYPEAVECVRSTGRASISTVQRVLKIGYNRAARLLEEMELAGVVSAPRFDTGERDVLATQGEG